MYSKAQRRILVHWLRPMALCVMTLLFSAPSNGVAHEFWIEPAEFRPAVKTALHIGLRVGHLEHADPVPRSEERIVKFDITGPRGTKAVIGREGVDPAGIARPGVAGRFVIAYQSTPKLHTMELDAFRGYAREKGLDDVVRGLADRDKPNEVREAYSRSAKALISVGEGPTDGFDRAVGLSLEIVPEDDPYLMDEKAGLRVKLLRDGKPVPNIVVFAVGRTDPSRVLSHRTDVDGRAVFQLARRDMWLLHAVQMIPAPPGSNAEWESFWASLTFDNRKPRRREAPANPGPTSAPAQTHEAPTREKVEDRADPREPGAMPTPHRRFNRP